jgi:hypothetical protein
MIDKLFDLAPYALQPIEPLKAGDGWEYDRADSFYTGKSIRDVNLDAYQNYPGDWASSIYLLTPHAFQFFLPAFIRIATEVRSWPNAENHYAINLGGNVVSILAFIADGEMEERKSALFDAYSITQLEAVATFLEEEVRWDGSENLPDIAVALRFWRQFKRQ